MTDILTEDEYSFFQKELQKLHILLAKALYLLRTENKIVYETYINDLDVTDHYTATLKLQQTNLQTMDDEMSSIGSEQINDNGGTIDNQSEKTGI
jgi:hypothetical protein